MSDKASILIIDDEDNLRRTLAIIFHRAGYGVMTVGTVKEARLLLDTSTYDLAFLDLKLPDESGLTLLPELRNKFPNMPVLILTAYDKLDAAIEAIHKGARDYLLKPVDPPVILKLVEEILMEGDQAPVNHERYTQLNGLLKELRPEDKPKQSPNDESSS